MVPNVILFVDSQVEWYIDDIRISSCQLNESEVPPPIEIVPLVPALAKTLFAIT